MQTNIGLRALAVILLSVSLTACASLSNKAKHPPVEVAVCDSSAFIDVTKYTLTELTDKSDQAFHLWATENAANNPIIIKAYKNLFECWTTYHGKPKL